MITVLKVLEKFSLMSKIDSDELSNYEDLCKDCLDETLSRVKQGVDPNDFAFKICHLAAALAFYRYTLQNTARGENDNIKVGDITLSRDKKNIAQSAAALYSEAVSSAADILIDGDFWFGGVSV